MKLKQVNLGRRVGGLRLQASQALFYLSIYNFFLIGAAAIEKIQQWFPWVNFYMILVSQVVVYVLAILFEHYVVYKSVVSYTTKQSYIPANPAYVDHQTMKKDIELIKAKLGIDEEEKKE